MPNCKVCNDTGMTEWNKDSLKFNYGAHLLSTPQICSCEAGQRLADSIHQRNFISDNGVMCMSKNVKIVVACLVFLFLSVIVFWYKPVHAKTWAEGAMKYIHYNGGCSEKHRPVIASIYWEDQMTATGGHFNPNGLTAAHKTLPFGTKVKVVNPKNGHSVHVMINDRGPYVNGVEFDLAKGAADAIGMTGSQYICVTEL